MKILLVDDNELILHRLSLAIKNLNKNILIRKARDCEEALRQFSAFYPDLVILDISLPDGSGIDLLLSMKSENPQISVGMLTNYATADFKKRCMELGADYFFEKTGIPELIHSIGQQYKSINTT